MKKEKEILSFLSHPNIIKFKAFFENPETNSQILITELFSSIQIGEFIKQNELKAPIIQEILKQIFDGLNYLHENNIVHQDFNVKNILIDPKTLQIKIIDFGLSKTESNDQIVWSPQGNLKYRPPQIICNEKSQSYFFMDIWCLCLIVLSLLMKIPISSKKVLNC